jgi:hypothetical protein
MAKNPQMKNAIQNINNTVDFFLRLSRWKIQINFNLNGVKNENG